MPRPRLQDLPAIPASLVLSSLHYDDVKALLSALPQLWGLFYSRLRKIAHQVLIPVEDGRVKDPAAPFLLAAANCSRLGNELQRLWDEAIMVACATVSREIMDDAILHPSLMPDAMDDAASYAVIETGIYWTMLDLMRETWRTLHLETAYRWATDICFLTEAMYEYEPPEISSWIQTQHLPSVKHLGPTTPQKEQQELWDVGYVADVCYHLSTIYPHAFPDYKVDLYQCRDNLDAAILSFQAKVTKCPDWEKKDSFTPEPPSSFRLPAQTRFQRAFSLYELFFQGGFTSPDPSKPIFNVWVAGVKSDGWWPQVVDMIPACRETDVGDVVLLADVMAWMQRLINRALDELFDDSAGTPRKLRLRQVLAQAMERDQQGVEEHQAELREYGHKAYPPWVPGTLLGCYPGTDMYVNPLLRDRGGDITYPESVEYDGEPESSWEWSEKENKMIVHRTWLPPRDLPEQEEDEADEEEKEEEGEDQEQDEEEDQAENRDEEEEEDTAMEKLDRKHTAGLIALKELRAGLFEKGKTRVAEVLAAQGGLFAYEFISSGCEHRTKMLLEVVEKPLWQLLAGVKGCRSVAHFRHQEKIGCVRKGGRGGTEI